MAPVVVLILAALAPALSLPFTTPEIQTNQSPQLQHGEKTVATGCAAEYQVPVTKVQNAEVEQPHIENFFAPSQPVAVSQAEQILRPVVVPAEAIATGRVIIMAVDPIQQRAFPDVVVVPQTIVPETQIQAAEKQTPFTTVVQNVQQVENIHPAQKQDVQSVPVVVQEEVQVQKQAPTSQEVQSVQQEVQKQVKPQQRVHATQKQTECAVKAQTDPQQRVNVEQPIEQVQQSQVEVQTYNVQPEQVQQSQVGVQTYNVQPEQVQQSQVGVQTYNVQPEQVQQSQVGVQTYNVQSEQVQQSQVGVQTYNVQPEQVVQEFQPQQAVQQVTRTENQQVQNVPQQISTFASQPVYNFGDKVPQRNPAVPQQQVQVQPVVVVDQ